MTVNFRANNFILQNTSLMTMIFLILNLSSILFLSPLNKKMAEFFDLLYLINISGIFAIGTVLMYDFLKLKIYQIMFYTVYIFGTVSIITFGLYVYFDFHYAWGMVYIISLISLIVGPLFLHFLVYMNFEIVSEGVDFKPLKISSYEELLIVFKPKYHLLFSHFGRIIPDWYYLPSINVHMTYNYLIVDNSMIKFEDLLSFMKTINKEIEDFDSLTREDIKLLQMFII